MQQKSRCRQKFCALGTSIKFCHSDVSGRPSWICRFCGFREIGKIHTVPRVCSIAALPIRCCTFEFLRLSAFAVAQFLTLQVGEFGWFAALAKVTRVNTQCPR
jgi:hypothetical protein